MTSTIAEVWEFLHAFVVEAARAGEDLGQGWKFQGRDVTGLVKELYDRNTGNSDYGRLNEWSVAWSLGIDHTVLKRIIKGSTLSSKVPRTSGSMGSRATPGRHLPSALPR